MIAEDAELQEKSEAALKSLLESLHKNVEESMSEYNEKIKDDPNHDGKIFQLYNYHLRNVDV